MKVKSLQTKFQDLHHNQLQTEPSLVNLENLFAHKSIIKDQEFLEFYMRNISIYNCRSSYKLLQVLCNSEINYQYRVVK